jgi:translation elongation factor EF-Tu-like GTPase
MSEQDQIPRITVLPPDLLAKIAFLRTEEGGRSGPARSGYRPNHDFGLPGTLNDAAHEYVGQDWAAPGETVDAKVWLLVPELQRGRLHTGFTFTVQEGSRVVGKAIVQEVLNALLLKGDA